MYKHAGSRKMPVRMQALSEQANAQSRPQVCREMLPIHCHAWTCLSIVTLECTSPAKRFPPKTVNEKKFPSTQSLTFILTEHGPVKILNIFSSHPLSILRFEYADVLPLFCYFRVVSNELF